ncbi:MULTISPECIES: hypothetical protein [Paenibacillus]|uniref:hypothetical protein n=1 Tax=Paenibacillus TaxID=44249 RepID=UPI0022B919F1|nr:hypothetical protein [Paenibacillus caseinilyticus]MCZ8521991.1 hypothetical protein [Paenibacillus caseinilyticus]
MNDREVRPLLSLRIGGPETVAGLKAYVDKPLQQKTDDSMEDNSKILITDPTASFNSPTRDKNGVPLGQIITDATYQYIMGKIDEKGFQSAIDKWKKEGGDAVIQEIGEQYVKLK